MKDPLAIAIEGIVACARPIPVAVDEADVESQKVKDSFDVQHRFYLRREILYRCGVESFTKLDERDPILFTIFAFDLVGSFVSVEFITKIFKSPAAARAAWYFPSSPFRVGETGLDKFLIELLGIDVQAPAFAIDNDMDEVGDRSQRVFLSCFQIKNGS